MGVETGEGGRSDGVRILPRVAAGPIAAERGHTTTRSPFLRRRGYYGHPTIHDDRWLLARTKCKWQKPVFRDQTHHHPLLGSFTSHITHSDFRGRVHQQFNSWRRTLKLWLILGDSQKIIIKSRSFVWWVNFQNLFLFSNKKFLPVKTNACPQPILNRCLHFLKFKLQNSTVKAHGFFIS